jgi:zinc and cadmium transporter
VSDGIHNLGDGIVIVASFMASSALGIATTLSIMVHEMLQEISEFFVLRDAGMSVRSALIWNFISSSSILVGAVGAYFLLGQFEALEVPLLGLAAGAYLIVVFHDLIPHSIADAKQFGHIVKHVAYFIIGLMLMSFVMTYLPHPEYEHEDMVLQNSTSHDIVVT